MSWQVKFKKSSSKASSVSVPDFTAIPDSQKISKLEQLSKSGHDSYRVTLESQDEYYFKINKKGHSSLSIQEVMASAFWNVYFPDFTPQSELVFGPAGEISGVISKGIKQGKALSREGNLNGDEIDYFSLAGVFVYSHTNFEDDLHRENILVVDGNKFYRIDFDMSYQMLAEQGIDGLDANKRGCAYIRNSQMSVITGQDCHSLPILTDADPHFWPLKSRVLDDPNWLSANLGLVDSKKGWDESLFGEGNLTKQMTDLSLNPQFIKWKWYHYVNYLLTPPDVLAEKIDARIKDITHEEDKLAAQGIKTAMLAEDSQRRAQFREELLKLPEFVRAIQGYKEEFIGRMVLDNQKTGRSREPSATMYLQLIKDGLRTQSSLDEKSSTSASVPSPAKSTPTSASPSPSPSASMPKPAALAPPLAAPAVKINAKPGRLGFFATKHKSSAYSISSVACASLNSAQNIEKVHEIVKKAEQDLRVIAKNPQEYLFCQNELHTKAEKTAMALFKGFKSELTSEIKPVFWYSLQNMHSQQSVYEIAVTAKMKLYENFSKNIDNPVFVKTIEEIDDMCRKRIIPLIITQAQEKIKSAASEREIDHIVSAANKELSSHSGSDMTMLQAAKKERLSELRSVAPSIGSM